MGGGLAILLWAAACGVVLAAMQRNKAAELAPAELEAWRALVAAEGAGWTARYHLPTDEREAEVLRRHWARRGSAPGLREEIVPAAGGAAATAADGRGRLELFTPEGELAWTGRYPSTELRLAGARVWDTRLIAAVMRGEAAPREVPVGCQTPGLGGGDRALFTSLFGNPSIP